MNPPFSTSQQTTRGGGNSIYNICAPSNYRMTNLPKFTDSYFKSFHHSTNNNIVDQTTLKTSSLPNPVEMEGLIMNMLKMNHTKEFNFNFNKMQPSGSSKMATAPLKIDLKQAGKSFWPHPNSPTPSPNFQTSMAFTVVSTVPFFDSAFFPGFVLGNKSSHPATDQKESAPTQEVKPVEEEFDIINKESNNPTKMEAADTTPPNQKMNAELKRLKKINKCKNRFNPLKFRSKRSKDPQKNLRTKQRNQIDQDILSDCEDIDTLNESLEQLLLEKSGNRCTTAAMPICKKMHTILEDSENVPEISACSPEFINLPPESDDEIEEDFVLLAKRSEKAETESEATETEPGPSTLSASSTPNTSPRKTLGLYEKFDRIIAPTVANTPPSVVVPVCLPRRERTISECSEDSFIVFVNTDGSTEFCDMDDFEDDCSTTSSSSNESGTSDSESEESDSEEEDSSDECSSEDETEIETDLQFPYNEVHEEVDGATSTSTKKHKSGHSSSKQPDSGFHENGPEKVSFFNCFIYGIAF